jgi:hypothetical protein
MPCGFVWQACRHRDSLQIEAAALFASIDAIPASHRCVNHLHFRYPLFRLPVTMSCGVLQCFFAFFIASWIRRFATTDVQDVDDIDAAESLECELPPCGKRSVRCATGDVDTECTACKFAPIFVVGVWAWRAALTATFFAGPTSPNRLRGVFAIVLSSAFLPGQWFVLIEYVGLAGCCAFTCCHLMLLVVG